MRYKLAFGAAALLAGASAHGAVFFYDLDGGGQPAFDADLATYGYTMQSATAWGGLPDWSITGIDGPVNTGTANAIFNPGDIPFDLEFDSNLTPWGTGGNGGRGPGRCGPLGRLWQPVQRAGGQLLRGQLRHL